VSTAKIAVHEAKIAAHMADFAALGLKSETKVLNKSWHSVCNRISGRDGYAKRNRRLGKAGE